MKLLKWLINIVLLAIIIALSCASEATVNQWGNTLLKILGTSSPVIRQWVMNSPSLWHVVLYGLLATGLMVSMPGRSWRGALLAIAVAALLELAQLFIPSREAGLPDFLFSVAGAAVMYGVMRLRRSG